MSDVRLFGRLNLQHRGDRHVEQVKVRIQAAIPGGATVKVTDVQLQPGRFVTGWTLHPSDLGVEAVPGWEWRNAVVSGDQVVVVTADVASASPTLWDVRGTSADVRVGRYFFGPVAGSSRVDGEASTASQGAGLPPHLTARADVDVPAHVTGRALLCCWFRGLAVAANTDILPPAPPHADGPLTTAHPLWGQALAAHLTWADLLTAHPDWS